MIAAATTTTARPATAPLVETRPGSDKLHLGCCNDCPTMACGVRKPLGSLRMMEPPSAWRCDACDRLSRTGWTCPDCGTRN